MKNPHAVALGRLGGAKGGRARAEALSPTRRSEIASAAGAARARLLSPAERQALARKAADARWAQQRSISTLDEAPLAVRRLLKSYDPAKLLWSDRDARYVVVREILVRGDESARSWLRTILRGEQVRKLVRHYRGAGCNEPARKKLRTQLRLSVEDIPTRSYLGLTWRRGD